MEIDTGIIIQIHDEIASSYNLNKEMLNVGYLDSIIYSMGYIFRQNVYEEIFWKASVLFEGIIRKHPFIDGNKRTALATIQEYLFINGIIFVTPLSAVRFSIKIASNTHQGEENILQLQESIYRWVKYYSLIKSDESHTKLLKSMINREIKLIEKIYKLENNKMGKTNIQCFIDYITGKDIYPSCTYTFESVMEFYKQRLNWLTEILEL